MCFNYCIVGHGRDHCPSAALMENLNLEDKDGVDSVMNVPW